jgi:hypothetical protein
MVAGNDVYADPLVCSTKLLKLRVILHIVVKQVTGNDELARAQFLKALQNAGQSVEAFGMLATGRQMDVGCDGDLHDVQSAACCVRHGSLNSQASTKSSAAALESFAERSPGAANVQSRHNRVVQARFVAR